MRFFSRHLALAVLVLLGGASASLAAQPDTEAMRARIEQQWQETVQRLQLRDEQIAAAKPIVQQNMEERMAILSEFRSHVPPGQKPSRTQLMALRDQMQSSRAALHDQLTPILSSEQLAEFDTIQEERRAAMRQKFLNGDFGGAP